MGNQYNIAFGYIPPSERQSSFPPLLYGLEVEVPPVSRSEVLSPSLEFVLFMDVMDRSIKTRFVDADEKCN